MRANPDDTAYDLVWRMAHLAMPEDAGRVWFARWQAAARLLTEHGIDHQTVDVPAVAWLTVDDEGRAVRMVLLRDQDGDPLTEGIPIEIYGRPTYHAVPIEDGKG